MKDVMKAIQCLFNDTSVSASETLEMLEEITEYINELIDALKAQIGNNDD